MQKIVLKDARKCPSCAKNAVQMSLKCEKIIRKKCEKMSLKYTKKNVLKIRKKCPKEMRKSK